jgi:hypothetical protein
MTRFATSAPQQDPSSTGRARCPSWCVVAHGSHLGEEDWLHTSEPIALAVGVWAELVMSIHPDTGATDGPFVTIGETELTPPEAAALATRLLALIAFASEGRERSV